MLPETRSKVPFDLWFNRLSVMLLREGSSAGAVLDNFRWRQKLSLTILGRSNWRE